MKTGENRQWFRCSMVAAFSALMCLSTAQIAEAETYKATNWNQVQSYINGAENDDVIDLSSLPSPSDGVLGIGRQVYTIKIPQGKSLTLKGNTGTTYINTAFVFEGNNTITIEDLKVTSANSHNGSENGTPNGGNVAYSPLYFSKGDNVLTIKGTNVITSGQSSVTANYGAAVNITNQANLTITAETGSASLTAAGGTSGAGIGGGEKSQSGDIFISGGTIIANGGDYAAGIGNGGGGSAIGDITINGGTVKANGKSGAAGIGGGSATEDKVNSITISGGTVTATGANRGVVIGTDYGGSGIGGGGGTKGVVGSITISGGNVTATGLLGAAGIGSGGNENSKIDDITISGGIVNATGGRWGAGIGNGGYSSSVLSKIAITGGTITAKGGENSAGIGKGSENTVGNIVIDGGSVRGLDSSSKTSVLPRPQNSVGTDVYLNTLSIPNHIDEYVAEGSINDVDCGDIPDVQAGIYGINGVKTISEADKVNGNLYFYLPASGEDGEEILLIPSSITYGAYGVRYVRESNDSSAQTLAGVLEVSIAAPEAGGIPQTEISETMYSGTVTWRNVDTGNEPDGVFSGETVYKASISLKALSSWSPTYVKVESGTVSDTKVSGNTLTFDVLFPVTAEGEAAGELEPGADPEEGTSVLVVSNIWSQLQNAIASAISKEHSSITIDLKDLRDMAGDEVATISIPEGEIVILKGVTGKTFNKVAFRFEGNNKVIIENLSIKSDNNHISTYSSLQGPAPLYFVSGKNNSLVFRGENVITSGHTTTGKQGYGAAVGINFNSNLTISAAADDPNASLTTNGGMSGAGIGGGESLTVGSITINSGRITAKGGRWAPGIGTGGSNGVMENITINGGVITATGGSGDGTSGGAAGIGLSSSTANSIYNTQISNIEINGGTVNAVGTEGGAGIGTGYGKGGKISNIQINKGTVIATGGASASALSLGTFGGGAGIGNGDSQSGIIDSICITGGRIIAKGGNGTAGIGGSVAESNSVGNITINGGTVTATGGGVYSFLFENFSGAGIGQGGKGDVGSITIDGGTVKSLNNNSQASILPRPQNSDGKMVYLNTIVIPKNSEQYVAKGSINGVSCAETADAKQGIYGINDVRMMPNDSNKVDGNLYFYLTPTGDEKEEILITPASTTNSDYGVCYIRESSDGIAKTLAEVIRINITDPQTGEIPQSVISDKKFSGTITWYDVTNEDEELSGNFAGNTVYKAIVKLKSSGTYNWPAAMYVLSADGTISNTQVSGAGSGNILTFDVTFPATNPIKEYTLQEDGTYRDGDGNIYVKDGDEYVPVTQDENGNFVDETGNVYVPNEDGSFDKYTPAVEEGKYIGPDGDTYVVDEGGNFVKDESGDEPGDDDYTLNEDGTYSDKDGNIYIKDDEEYVPVTPDENGNYVDEVGNVYVPNEDGGLDKYTPAEEEGKYTGPDGDTYAVDEEGNFVKDVSGEVPEDDDYTLNEDGTYSDKDGNIYIKDDEEYVPVTPDENGNYVDEV
ncbi:hypothetical protein FYJ38_21565, partial [Clostridium sp. WB02_MRS01]|nr:hypothetical protein [Clostridium sp. WB02_MRS01]